MPDFQVDRQYERYRVDDPTGEIPGTIVIDTHDNYLYFVEPNKKAIRYGVATGSEALANGRRSGWSKGGMAALDATGRYARALAAFETDGGCRRTARWP